MNRYALAGTALLALGGTAFADGFIGMGGFSGGETVIDFNSTDMTLLSHPTANIGNGITVTDSGGGTGNGAWRGNTDWSSLFSNIPGASLGRALADSWGSSDLLYDFTGAGNPNRAGMLLSTGTATTWTVEVYGSSFNLLGTTNVTMPGASMAVFVGYEASAGIGYIRLTDVENGFITIMDDVRFESTGGGGPSISSYDIRDAAKSGFGGWGHTYGGTIVDTGSFSANGFAFDRANYSGGSGTLNDGSEGTGTSDTQLFANNGDARPRITLHLDGTYNVSSLLLANWDSGNSIPGTLVGCDVTINGQTESFTTTEPSLRDELVDLSGSPLSRLCTDTVIIDNFIWGGNNGLDEMFCIGEISVRGQACSGGIDLSVRGTCPGSVTVSWSGAQPSSTVALIFAKNTGSFVIPFGPCQGTVLGLGANQIRLVNTFGAGSNGSGSRSGQAGSSACGGYLQMHDIPNCTLSNVAQLP